MLKYFGAHEVGRLKELRSGSRLVDPASLATYTGVVNNSEINVPLLKC